jgi:hypothetical protein
MKKEVIELIRRKQQLERELFDVKAQIEAIRNDCDHENKQVLRRYQDPGSGRTLYDYECLDCGLIW